jgi:hypothetical protein
MGGGEVYKVNPNSAHPIRDVTTNIPPAFVKDLHEQPAIGLLTCFPCSPPTPLVWFLRGLPLSLRSAPWKATLL